MTGRGDGVVLLHGMARGSRSMRFIERALRDDGYATLDLDYPGRRQNLDALAEHVADAAGPWIDGLAGRVHIVAHSMGGLIARVMISRRRPANLGRVVMLGPPNQGSEIADLLVGITLDRTMFGPAGAELTTSRTNIEAARLGKIDFCLGVIAGTRSIDPLGRLVLPKPNDGKMTVERTKVEGMADHLTLAATHALVMRDPAVLRATLRFLHDVRLGDGRFGGG